MYDYGIGKCFKCRKFCDVYSGMRWISEDYYSDPEKSKSYMRLWCKRCSNVTNTFPHKIKLYQQKPSKFYKRKRKHKK